MPPSRPIPDTTPPPQISAHQELWGEFGPYLADPGLIAAANVALALEMPLLLTGQPGCGKTDFAYVLTRVVAAAQGHDPHTVNFKDDAGHGLLECNVRTDSRARDLLYGYDAMVRFGDSQHGDDDTRHTARDPRNYIELEPLGIGLMSSHLRVVLIDEIDKAPRDLPNDLLREIERGEFDIPELPRNRRPSMTDKEVCDPITGVPLRRRMQRVRKPVVVITSNDERQLPEAFLRRCAFYHLLFPNHERLLNIVEKRMPEPGPLSLDTLVEVFEYARKIPELNKPPSTAEMLNWAAALVRTGDPAASERQIQDFATRMRAGDTLPWAKLPGLSCLFKTHQDLRTAVKHAMLG